MRCEGIGSPLGLNVKQSKRTTAVIIYYYCREIFIKPMNCRSFGTKSFFVLICLVFCFTAFPSLPALGGGGGGGNPGGSNPGGSSPGGSNSATTQSPGGSSPTSNSSPGG